MRKKSHSLQELKDTTVKLHIFQRQQFHYTSRSGHIQVLQRSRKFTLALLFYKIKEGKLHAEKNNSQFPPDTGFLCNNTSMKNAIVVIAYVTSISDDNPTASTHV